MKLKPRTKLIIGYSLVAIPLLPLLVLWLYGLYQIFMKAPLVSSIIISMVIAGIIGIKLIFDGLYD